MKTVKERIDDMKEKIRDRKFEKANKRAKEKLHYYIEMGEQVAKHIRSQKMINDFYARRASGN